MAKVWAESIDVPGHVCADARLHMGAEGKQVYANDSTYGQAGWDVGLRFKSLDDLAKQLKQIRTSTGEKITRLAIHAHGQSAGNVLVEGKYKPEHALTADSVEKMGGMLDRIRETLGDHAKVLIAGCVSGSGLAGTNLLVKLSKRWPGRTVVGYVTMGWSEAGSQSRAGEACTEPGMRDTDLDYEATEADKVKIGKIWTNLEKLPWVTETSKHAKAALNGKLILSPPEDTYAYGERKWDSIPAIVKAWHAYADAVINKKMDMYTRQRDLRNLVIDAERGQHALSGQFGPNKNLPPWSAEDDAIAWERKTLAEKHKHKPQHAVRSR